MAPGTARRPVGGDRHLGREPAALPRRSQLATAPMKRAGFAEAETWKFSALFNACQWISDMVRHLVDFHGFHGFFSGFLGDVCKFLNAFDGPGL